MLRCEYTSCPGSRYKMRRRIIHLTNVSKKSWLCQQFDSPEYPFRMISTGRQTTSHQRCLPPVHALMHSIGTPLKNDPLQWSVENREVTSHLARNRITLLLHEDVHNLLTIGSKARGSRSDGESGYSFDVSFFDSSDAVGLTWGSKS